MCLKLPCKLTSKLFNEIFDLCEIESKLMFTGFVVIRISKANSNSALNASHGVI